jgi:hypothetical protein
MHAFYAAQHPRKYHLFVDRQEAGSAFRGSHDVGQGRQQMARSFVDVVDGAQSAERPARNWRWQQRPRAWTVALPGGGGGDSNRGFVALLYVLCAIGEMARGVAKGRTREDARCLANASAPQI